MKILAFILLCTRAIFAQSDDEEDTSTTLCDNAKGAEFFAQIDGCSSLARLDFILAFSEGNIADASCDLIKARVSKIFKKKLNTTG